MVEPEEESSNRRTPPPLPSGAPPPQAGEERDGAPPQELSDGLERSMTLEGADVAPESPDGLEDKKNGGPGGTRTPNQAVMSRRL